MSGKAARSAAQDRPRHAQDRPRASHARRQKSGDRHGGDRACAGGEQHERERRVGQVEQRLHQRDRDGPGADGEAKGEEDRRHADARSDNVQPARFDCRRSARHPGRVAIASALWDRVHRLESVRPGAAETVPYPIPAPAATGLLARRGHVGALAERAAALNERGYRAPARLNFEPPLRQGPRRFVATPRPAPSSRPARHSSPAAPRGVSGPPDHAPADRSSAATPRRRG